MFPRWARASPAAAELALFYLMYLYMNGFSYMKMGYASAMAIVLFLIVLVVSFVAMYLMEKRVTYDVE